MSADTGRLRLNDALRVTSVGLRARPLRAALSALGIAIGTAAIVPLPEAMDLLVKYYRTISGEHENWDDYRAAMQREQRVILRISLTGAGPDRTG